MREDLEKKYVTVNMKKIYWKLQLCFFILLLLFIANVLDIVHLGIFYIPFLFGIICLLWNKGNPWWSFICAGLLLWVNHKSTNK